MTNNNHKGVTKNGDEVRGVIGRFDNFYQFDATNNPTRRDYDDDEERFELTQNAPWRKRIGCPTIPPLS